MEFNSFLILWVALAGIVPKPTVYEIDNFYIYDVNHKQQALPLQKKIFVPFSKGAEAYVDTLQQPVKKITATSKNINVFATWIKGWVVDCRSNDDAIKMMLAMSKTNIPYKPVVKWEGMDSIPTNVLIIKAKPFVTEKLLRQRLRDATKIDILHMSKNENEEWVVEIGDTIVPANVLVLANMISEDTMWIEWARVMFEPLYATISGTMEVTPVVLNLGYEKQLNIVITVYKPSIKIRKDLLPILGTNRFVPSPQKEDVWYDFGQTTITEERTADKYVLRMTTPFRYLNYGEISFIPIEVAYDDGNEKGTISISGISYMTQSVIDGTNINDIQSMPGFPAITGDSLPNKNYQLLLPWHKIGALSASVGFFLIAVLCVWMGLSSANNAADDRAASATRKRLWRELRDAPKIDNDWRLVYMNTSDKLAKVLSEFYNVNTPISSDSVENPALRAILFELEKLYEPNPQPDVKNLLTYVNIFVGQNV